MHVKQLNEEVEFKMLIFYYLLLEATFRLESPSAFRSVISYEMKITAHFSDSELRKEEIPATRAADNKV